MMESNRVLVSDDDLIELSQIIGSLVKSKVTDDGCWHDHRKNLNRWFECHNLSCSDTLTQIIGGNVLEHVPSREAIRMGLMDAALLGAKATAGTGPHGGIGWHEIQAIVTLAQKINPKGSICDQIHTVLYFLHSELLKEGEGRS
jgi:hypothetical protein